MYGFESYPMKVRVDNYGCIIRLQATDRKGGTNIKLG